MAILPLRRPALLPPLALAISLLVTYLSTLAPGLSWANHGADGGDLLAAAVTGGVAHPTGYPLYLLLARLFLWLPAGSPAFRTNLLSAVFAAAAALLVYAICWREGASREGFRRWMPALCAGLAAGLSPLLWSQAVITEVYALQAFLVVLILFLSSPPWSAPIPARADRLRGLVLGLAMGSHLTTLLLSPAAMLASAVRRGEEAGSSWKLDGRSLGRQLGFFAAGCLVYLSLPLRAASHPPVNWGNPVTAGRLWWLVSGQLYIDQLLQAAEPGNRLRAWAALLLEQFGMAGLTLGIVGLVVLFRPSRLNLLTAWTFVVFSLFAAGFASADSHVHLLPAFLAFSIWIGQGTGWLMELAGARSARLAWAAGLAVLLFFTGLGGSHWREVDASQDRRAADFSAQVMARAPEGAILFAQGDQAVFALWYAHYGLKQRPDLVIIASDLLPYDWYQENLQATYPGLALPGPFLWPETLSRANPARPACLVEYAGATHMDCSDALPAGGAAAN